MEQFSYEEVEAVVARDYSSGSTPTKRDVQQAHIMLNTWASLIEETGTPYVFDFVRYVKTQSLSGVIDEAKDALTALRQGLPLPRTVWSAFVTEFGDSYFLTTVILGFPVRFTYQDNMSSAKKTTDEFIKQNDENKAYDYEDHVYRDGKRGPARRNTVGVLHTLPLWFERELKEIGRTILSRWCEGYNQAEPRIPTGATFECPRNTSPAAKAVAAAKLGYNHYGYFPDSWIDVPFDQICKKVSSWDPFEKRWYHEYIPFRENVSRLICVPKNYKAMRTIAAEECYRQIELGRYADAIDYCYMHYLPPKKGSGYSISAYRKMAPSLHVLIKSQTRNQEMARLGSISGFYATIDFSHASDSLSARICSLILPPELYNSIMRLRANRVEINGVKRKLHIFATMGSRITFPLERHAFKCLGELTRRKAKEWFGIDTKLEDYTYFGDDCIVPSSVAELFMQFAELAGFTPNQEKSFWTGEYRESCGEEYYKGISAKGIYWPRREIDFEDEDDLASLVALQQRLTTQFPKTAHALSVLLNNRYPNLQPSEIGREGLVLWDPFPASLHKDRKVPVRKGMTEAEYASLTDRLTKLWANAHGDPERDVPDPVRYPGQNPLVREEVKISRLHQSYTSKKVSEKVRQAGEILAYVSELRGNRMYYDETCEILHVTQKPDRKRFTSVTEQSVRARYES